jgi:hypothetical protein
MHQHVREETDEETDEKRRLRTLDGKMNDTSVMIHLSDTLNG